jgi:hypothetical protein
VHYHCENYDRAYPALREALKHKPNNWKLLENLVIVGIHLQKYVALLFFSPVKLPLKSDDIWEMMFFIRMLWNLNTSVGLWRRAST